MFKTTRHVQAAVRPRTDSQNEAFSSKFYGIMITKSISYKTSMFTIQNVERSSSQAQGTPLHNCIEALAQGRGHRHNLKELPCRIALKHLLRGDAIEDSFWKFPEPCLSNLNVQKF